MGFGLKIPSSILRNINAIVCSSLQEADTFGKVVKTGLSGADIAIGTSHAIQDFACNDKICGSIDIIGNISSAVGLALGNIPATQHLTLITGSVTIGCRSVRYYCKKYGTFWGCSVIAGQGVKEIIKFTIKK